MHPRFRRRHLNSALWAIVLAWAPSVPAAEAFPSRAVTIVSPSQAGSVVDNISRMLGVRLSALWGQPVVVEPKGGAGGVVGANSVASAAPNGYTLLLGSNGTNAINPALYTKLPYDAERAFAPVAQVGTSHLVVVVSPRSRVHSIADLVAAARERPGQMTFGSGGSGTTPHLAGEMFKKVAKVDMIHVPYKGSPQSLTDLRSGRIDVIFASAGTAMSLVRSGELRAIATTSGIRDPDLPDVPTVREQGLQGFQADQWFGVFAPAGTPRDVVARIQDDVAKVLAMPEVVASFRQMAITPAFAPAQRFEAFTRDELARWAAIVRQSGARAD